MEAVVLVGGQGTRLRPLTLTTPKPMLPAANVPFLSHQLAIARAAGVEHVVLATSYRAELFAAYFGDGSAVGMRLDYVTETEPLGTGGGIRNVVDRLESGPDDPVVVLNGDVLSDHDLAGQIAGHCESRAAVTLHLVHVDDPRAFGSVPTDADGRVTAFVEKSPRPVSNQVNAGCYVFRRSVLDAIPPARVVSVERDVFPQLLRAGEMVRGHVDDGYWLDVGTPAAYVRAGADLVRGLIRSPALSVTGEATVDPSADVHPDATLTGGTAVGPGARVDAGAVVDGSVVMAGAVIGRGAVVGATALGRDVQVATDCVLRDAVVGDGAHIGAGNELTAGARVWPGITLPAGAVRFSSDG